MAAFASINTAARLTRPLRVLRVAVFSILSLAGVATMGLSSVHAGWVDTDLDHPSAQTAPASYRSTGGPASSIELLVNLQGQNARVPGTSFSNRRTATDSAWAGLGDGQLVDAAVAPLRGGYASSSGPALGSASGQGVGLFGSGAIPASSGFVQRFGTTQGPTSIYGGNAPAVAVDERALVRRVSVPVHYDSAPGAAEGFVRWMQDNREVIIGGGFVLLVLVGLGSVAAGARH